jgi:Holliday junction resolvase RusA-like endonuclease
MIEQKISIKPLSVNDAWKGQRFKTEKHKWYETQLMFLLSHSDELADLKKNEKLAVELYFGFSSQSSDWDNGIKQFMDVISKKYGFNDNRIYRGVVEKEIVKKGEEYVRFRIYKLNL